MKPRRAVYAHNGDVWRVFRPQAVVADLHHFGDKQDPDPHQSKKRDPDPYPDPDPQHCFLRCLLYRMSTNYPSYPGAAMHKLHIQYVGTEGDDQCQLSYANEHLAESFTVTLFSFHPHAQYTGFRKDIQGQTI
jgi:hypothetical protein